MNHRFIGIDAGSVSAKIVVVDSEGEILYQSYALHHGNPLGACITLAENASAAGFADYAALCTTGSARKLVGASCCATLIKNEITALWRAVTEHYPRARTIIEIGGQDSKLISLHEGEIDSFRLNSVCAAGTGSFIQQQASRLGLSIEELSRKAADTAMRAHFSGRCTVFVETEMINLQQQGYTLDSIAAGLSDAICENYLKDLSPGIKLSAPYIFCGGVAALESVRQSFEARLGSEPVRPEFFRVAGAYGAALLARDSGFAEGKERTLTFSKLPATVKNSKACTDCLVCGKCMKPGM
jgi:predicted CoA-substrate-specific enzyme activase